jgi:uncharacterized protein YeaO (DUF488 family)
MIKRVWVRPQREVTITLVQKQHLHVQLKRAYASPSPEDGVRVLVDRLWPRGLRKSQAAIDRWVKDVAPSTELRRWFGHDPSRWVEFRRRYKAELVNKSELLGELRAIARNNTPGMIDRQDLLAPDLAEPIGDDPQDRIRRAAGSRVRDDRDGPVWVLLRLRGT